MVSDFNLNKVRFVDCIAHGSNMYSSVTASTSTTGNAKLY